MLKGRLPKNQVLSHDLLEGCFARSGLVSDIQLCESSPSTYHADVDRRRCWIRGDWQLIRWLLPVVAGSSRQTQKNPVSILSKWKLLVNLRRSVTPASLVLLIYASWTILPNALLSTLISAGIIFIPALAVSFFRLFRRSKELPLRSHLACLPHEALYSLGAIARSAWRMMISHRLLLEWKPSDVSVRYAGTDLSASLVAMAVSPVLAAATFAFLGLAGFAALHVAAPILGLWLV